MHDVLTLERKFQVPAIALVSSALGSQALYQSSQLGHTEGERSVVLVEHPISDATTAELQGKAADVYQEIVRSLTSEDGPSADRCARMRKRNVGPSEVCMLGG